MESFQAVLDHFDDMVSIHDLRGKCLAVSASQMDILGFAEDELLDKNPYQWAHWEDRAALRQTALALQRHSRARLIWRCRRRDNSYLWLETRLRILFNANGCPEHLLCVSRDITTHKALEAEKESRLTSLSIYNAQLEQRRAELEERNTRLESQITLDGLTGLKNYIAFQDQLELEFQRARRYGHPLSLVLLDLDYFKLYNDTFGHPSGNLALQVVARLLAENARQTDFVGRYGGEEFALILPDTDLDGAIKLTERFRMALQDWPWPQGRVTASFGVACLTPFLEDKTALIRVADQALYMSKRRGRNCTTHL